MVCPKCYNDYLELILNYNKIYLQCRENRKHEKGCGWVGTPAEAIEGEEIKNKKRTDLINKMLDE